MHTDVQFSEADFIRKRFSQLERSLALKQLQINSLLEITEAVNHNIPVYALLKIYENILRAQLGINTLAVLMKESQEIWKCETCNNNTFIFKNEADFFQFLSGFRHITPLANHQDRLPGFDYLIPVAHKKEPIGYALIGDIKNTGNTDNLEEKLKFVQTLTNIILVANENKRLFKNQLDQMLLQKELRLAEDIQKMLIPGNLQNNEYIEISAFYKPHKNIGGDYYDYIQISDSETAFCIGDISGKGVPAALLMANFQANLRSLITRRYPLDQMIDILNFKLSEITKGERYITFFIAVYDSDSRKLSYVNAGHNPSLLLNGGEIVELDKGCTILGAFSSLPYIHMGELYLEEGALIVNYTDGISEAGNANNELFECERIVNYMQQNAMLGVEVFNKGLIEEVMSFKQGTDFDDDLTLVTIRFK